MKLRQLVTAANLAFLVASGTAFAAEVPKPLQQTDRVAITLTVAQWTQVASSVQSSTVISAQAAQAILAEMNQQYTAAATAKEPSKK